MKKVLKIFTALIIAFAVTTLSACDFVNGLLNNSGNSGNNSGSNGGDGTISGGSTEEGATYSISYELYGGTLSENIVSYTAGEETLLPTATKEHYSFVGWYESDAFSGEVITKITENDEGDKTFYAKWAVDTYAVNLIVDGAAYTGADNVTSYSYDAAKPLPTPAKSGYNFYGWYTDPNYNGQTVSEIVLNSTGEKTFYGRFISQTELVLTSYDGYEEGAYVEFASVAGATNYKVEYKRANAGAGAFTAIDAELIREADGNVRADIVGISAGDYSIKVTAGSKQVEKTVAVTAYDRSGYAHFGATEGVGAYNDDGTPKANAYIIYVNEENKNTVTAPWDSSVEGIVEVLGNASKAHAPVIVRILGTVGAATWSASNWETLMAKYDAAEKNSSGKIINDSSIVGINSRQLPTSGSLTQDYLIANGYNVLDESEYSKLNGLESTYSYSSGSISGYDSCWNNCKIADASNVTVEGIGTDAMIFQWGMTWSNCSSIEVRNITFDDYTEDACSFEGTTGTTYTGMAVDKFNSNRLWVHNNTFNQGKNYWDICAEQDKREGDGATDFKRCAYVTVSYNHYYDNHKTGLIGADDNVFTANVTFHHNFYDQCNSRLPLGRQANMHMYNNYYYKSSGTNMSLRSGAYAFIENCYFENAKYPIQTILGTKSITLNGQSVTLDAYVKVYNCEFVEDELEAKYRLDTNSYNITIATSRTQEVANQNIYNQRFDTDANDFYYDSVNNRTNVTRMDDTRDVPTVVPQLAGVHKN